MVLSYLGVDLLVIKVGELSTLASSITKTFSLKKGTKFIVITKLSTQTSEVKFKKKKKLTMLPLKVKRTDVFYLAPGY